MKIKITYLPGEEDQARLIVDAVGGLLRGQGGKVKERCQSPPYRHIYISSKRPDNRDFPEIS